MPFDPTPFSAGRHGSARGAEREKVPSSVFGVRDKNVSSRPRYIDLLCRGVVKRSGGVHSAASASAGGELRWKGPCGVDAADDGVCFWIGKISRTGRWLTD
jgi:hypothetical protein